MNNVIDELREKAIQGNVEAQYKLGCAYAEGDNIGQNFDEAIRWWRTASLKGHTGSHHKLGGMYHHGYGVNLNYSKAIEHYMIPALTGNAQSCYNIGDCYNQNDDFYNAAIWFSVAYEIGGNVNPGFRLMAEMSKGMLSAYLPGRAQDAQNEARYIISRIKAHVGYNQEAIKKNLKQDYTGIEMIFVEGGTFQMGSANGDSDEKPVHSVTVSSFYIGKYEVTQSEWQAVMRSNPAYHWGVGANHPVNNVNWYEVLVYCNKRSILEGLTPCYAKNGDSNPNNWGSIPTSNNSSWNNITCNFSAMGYRLPTEAEWEFAAKGGNLSKGYTYSGSNNLDEVGWYKRNSGNQTRDVGTKKANELGIYDMSGNVGEWCWDWYGSYSSSSETNPKGASSGSYRVIRGGCWRYFDDFCRVTGRSGDIPDYSSNFLGFRLSRTSR